MLSFSIDMLLIVSFFTLLSSCVCGNGRFWHITDLHVDQNYSRTGNPADMCHSGKTSVPDTGLYGNYLCDSPQYLVNVTIKSMKEIDPQPDFIVWTGDNLPHSRNPDSDWDAIFGATKNITSLLTSTFPGIPIFTCIGNHDTFPPNGFPEVSRPIYDSYLHRGGWDSLIDEDEWPTFLKGGYYHQMVKPGLRIISLNTILWYTPNTMTSKDADPAEQLQWLEECLRNCSKASEKVYIIGHVPPGYYNRVTPGSKSDPTYHPQHHKAYLQILNTYSKVIIGQLYGHLHMDMFQIFQFGTGIFKSSSLLGSSVTPWHIPGKVGVDLPVNPAVRLVHYSSGDFALLDFEQYYLNLTEANSQIELKDAKNLYKLLYKFTEAYGVADLSTRSLVQVYEKLKNHQSAYDSFYHYLTAGKDSHACDKSCKVAQLCSMASIASDEYNSCMKGAHGSDSGISERPLTFVISLMVPTVLLLCIGCVVFRHIRKKRTAMQYEPFLQF